MTVAASLVQLLHRKNRQKYDLMGQLSRGPKLVAAARGRLEAAEEHVKQSKAKLQQLRLDADSKQLQMKSREDKLYSLNGKLNAAKENREYQALKDQIAADEQANLVLSDEILELLEEIDAQRVTLTTAEAMVIEAQAELQKVEHSVSDRKAVLEVDLAKVEEELAEAEKGLTGDFRREYMRLVSAKGEDAMAELEGNCCSGCYQSLTPQMLSRLSMGEPVLCPACGRLIYQDNNG